jgi:hypothetical protein
MLGDVGQVLPYVERGNGVEASVPGWYLKLEREIPIEPELGFWQTRNFELLYLGFDLPHAAATIARLLQHASQSAAPHA